MKISQKSSNNFQKDMRTLSKYVRLLQWSLNKTDAQMGETFGVSRQSWSRWRCLGDSDKISLMDGDNLAKLATMLGLSSIAYLFISDPLGKLPKKRVATLIKAGLLMRRHTKESDLINELS